ncbi:MAG: ferrous iron transport protein A [Candidatus Cloacimonetes bacterium]|nr:ferrous iron transport protein A [Candidatus Cloacimonadota bacterium]
MERINLTQMKSGEQGTVAQIIGGFGMQRRVESLGVRINVEVTKVSSQLMRGPVTIQVGNTKVALGFGMAQKIIVEKN